MKNIFFAIGFLLFTTSLFSQSQTINIGATANDGTGDDLRTAFIKTKENFLEIADSLNRHTDSLRVLTARSINNFTILNSNTTKLGNWSASSNSWNWEGQPILDKNALFSEQTGHPFVEWDGTTGMNIGGGWQGITLEDHAYFSNQATFSQAVTFTVLPKYNGKSIPSGDDFDNLWDNVQTIDDGTTNNAIAIGLIETTQGITTIAVNNNTAVNSTQTGNIGQNVLNIEGNTTAINSKQATLISGTNIKTVNSQSLLGNGNILIEGGTGGTGGIMTIYTGAEGATATENTISLLSDLATVNVLWIPEGTYEIGNGTIPAGKTLYFSIGAIFNITGTLTGDNTKLFAGANQIFTLTSNLAGTWSTTPSYPEWFGAKGDGTGTADFAALQKTLDVFSIPININKGSSNSQFDQWGCGNWTEMNGHNYIAELTLDVPMFGDLRIQPHTLIKPKDGFFGSLIISRRTPRRISGGNWVLPNYWEQSGYIASAQTDADKLEWAWNKNPVFYFPMADLMHTYGGYDYNSMKNTVQDIAMSTTQGYDRSVENNKFYKYDGIVIEADTSQYNSGTLEWRRLYKMVSYSPGDDFSNIAYTVAGTINTPGWQFVVGLANANLPFEQMTPTNWTNGSVVQNNTNASYYLGFENIYIQYADTALSLKGDLSQYGSYEGIAGYTFDNFTFDKCKTAIAFNSRTWEHSFTNLQIQCLGGTSAGGEESSIILEGSSQNNISGTLMDMFHDSTIYIKSGVGGISGTTINLTVQGNRLLEDFTKYSNANLVYTNPVGPTPIWHRALDNTHASTSSALWYKGSRMGIKEYDNTTVDDDDNPRSILELVGKSQYSSEPLLTIQSITNAYSANNTVDNLTGITRGIELGSQPSGQYYIRPGVGPMISYVLFDTLNSNGIRVDNTKFEIGLAGFRQNTTLTNSESGMKPNYQIWRKTAGTWYNSMTIDEYGKLGINGVTNPAFDFDANTDGTIRTAQIEDDGDIVKLGRLRLPVFAAAPTSPAPIFGEIYANSGDGHIYFYTGATWVVLY